MARLPGKIRSRQREEKAVKVGIREFCFFKKAQKEQYGMNLENVQLDKLYLVIIPAIRPE